MKWFRYLAGALLLSLLAACGGGGETDKAHDKALEAQRSIVAAVGSISESKQLAMSAVVAASNKRRALAVSAAASAPAVVITAEQLLNWAELQWPDLFPKGPGSSQVSYLGESYTIRVYATTNVIGITAAGEVRAQGPFNGNVVTKYGTLSDFTCQVMPTACDTTVGSKGPGNYSITKEGGHVWLPNLVDGKLTWLGTEKGGQMVALTSIKSVNFRSNRRGWGDDNATGAAPSPDGAYTAATNTCNRDRGLPTASTDSSLLWPDFSAAGWKLIGDTNPKMVFGQIEYGDYQPATISAVKRADGTVDIVVDFASDCLFGFGQGDKLINLDRTLPYEFAFHCKTCGANGTAGWGLGPNTTVPTVKKAYRKYDATTGRFTVTFERMACTDQGSISVNRHLTISDDGKEVAYDYGPNGFGAAWIALPGAKDGDPIWQAGPGIKFNQMFQIEWNEALCVQKQ